MEARSRLSPTWGPKARDAEYLQAGKGKDAILRWGLQKDSQTSAQGDPFWIPDLQDRKMRNYHCFKSLVCGNSSQKQEETNTFGDGEGPSEEVKPQG